MGNPGSSDQFVRLRHGALMPRVGFGTWQITGEDATRAVAEALECGYRLVDTAENYENELAVGAGVRASGLHRNEVFVTTKFNLQWHGEDLVRTALQRSIERLGVDYVDMLMIHWPNPAQGKYIDAWKGMVRLLQEKRLRAIATSNFKPSHLARLVDVTGVAPEVNQIQLNPGFPRIADRRFADGLSVVTQAWAPLGGQDSSLRASPVIDGLARRTGRTPTQILLRWHIQSDLAVVVKSADSQHMRDNLDVFDFVLAPKDMAAIDGLGRVGAAPIDSDVVGH